MAGYRDIPAVRLLKHGGAKKELTFTVFAAAQMSLKAKYKLFEIIQM